MHRTLIVARLAPDRSGEVARVFAESDRTELPRLVGVQARSLFTFDEVYVHLIESERDPGPAIRAVRDHPLFVDVTDRLARHVTPYRPDWREPGDAMAQEFYHWSADGTRP